MFLVLDHETKTITGITEFHFSRVFVHFPAFSCLPLKEARLTD